MSLKHVPMRMCVACRQMKSKRELICLRCKSGSVFIDRDHRGQGRGAYLCQGPDCLAKAIRSKALDRALGARIDESVLRVLSEEM